MTTGNLSCTTLTVSGAATTAALTCSGLITANAGLTLASGQTLTLTGATVAGAPTWSSSQAITLSTAAQPNVTSASASSFAVGNTTINTGLIGLYQPLTLQRPQGNGANGYAVEMDLQLFNSNSAYVTYGAMRAYNTVRTAGTEEGTITLSVANGAGALAEILSANKNSVTIAGTLSTGSNSISGGAISGTTLTANELAISEAFSGGYVATVTNTHASGNGLNLTTAGTGTENLILARSNNGSTIGLKIANNGTVTLGTGAVTIPSLAGTGTRAVVVDANGVLSAP